MSEAAVERQKLIGRVKSMQKAVGTILDEIIAARRRRLEHTRLGAPLEALQQALEHRAEYRDFAAAISGPGVQVIAEMKKASPSAGLLRAQYDVEAIASEYEAAGACALSVLTESDYFLGSLDDLRKARATTRVPVLRKDFLLDTYQIYESAALGADAILLIVAALADCELRALIELSCRLNVAALVEVHTEEELDRALAAGASIIGVNNRNLKTLEVDLQTSFRLREKIPPECLAVSESGIRSADDLRKLMGLGYHAALIGEQFMKSEHPGEALAEFLRGCG